MEQTNRMENEAGEARAKLESLIEKAKDAGKRLQEQTLATAKATDKIIRENPYPTLGVAFGLGLVVGVLVMWGRRD